MMGDTAILYDGVTRLPTTPGISGHMTQDRLSGCECLDMFSMVDPRFERWDGQEDLFLVLSCTSPEEMHPADVTTLVLELNGGGTIGIFGPDEGSIVKAKARLIGEVAYERRQYRLPPLSQECEG